MAKGKLKKRQNTITVLRRMHAVVRTIGQVLSLCLAVIDDEDLDQSMHLLSKKQGLVIGLGMGGS